MQPFDPVRWRSARHLHINYMRFLSLLKTLSFHSLQQLSLNHQYAQRAEQIISTYKSENKTNQTRDSVQGDVAPFLLYMAFAHTHTPLAYDLSFENASTRPGFRKVFGNTLAEVDHAIGQVVQVCIPVQEVGLLVQHVMCASCVPVPVPEQQVRAK